MANTTNLNMVKPAGTDHALISVINSNMDIIDGAVGALPSGSTLQGEIDSANTAITNLNTQMSSKIKVLTNTSVSFAASQKNVTISLAVGEAASNFDWVATLSKTYSGTCVVGAENDGNNLKVHIDASIRRNSETYGGYGVTTAFTTGVVAIGIRK